MLSQKTLKVIDRFKNQGVKAIYGGGKRSKGHGFWISRNGVPIINDGKATGNPNFWTFGDALKVLEKLEAKKTNLKRIFICG